MIYNEILSYIYIIYKANWKKNLHYSSLSEVSLGFI